MRTVRSDHATDEDLLARSAREPEAFGRFYDRYEGELLRFFFRATRRADLAADLTAEVFAAALAGASGFDRCRGGARTWLYAIARHELADTWERGRVEDRARRRLGMEPLALSDESIERIESIDLSPGGAALELLDELPADQRAAVHGRVLEERDYADLALALECSESVVRQRVSRGLRSLRARLEKAG
ncbi:MAG TPA: RNA polymerase sigma factor [Solirubrobacteraceae bacterium]|nr:RNA polymerase sigma factor [Solirubrobacteraceae bacterium]